jgi:hypothetical protein
MTQGHEQPLEAENVERYEVSPPRPNSIAEGAPPSAQPVLAHPKTATHGFKGLVQTAIVALVFGMIGAYAFHRFLEAPKVTANTADAGSPAGPDEPDSPKVLSDQLAKLSDHVDALSRRIDAIPRPSPPPDLSDLQVRVADLTEASERIPPIREAVERIEDRLDDLNRRVGYLGEPTRSAPPQVATATARHDDLNPLPEKPVELEALEQGAALFKQQKYEDAHILFSKLAQTSPDDARVWYYAALAHGFATKQWTDDATGALVEKGIARERAGTPPSPVIDQTFKDLTSDTGKDWLAAYRKRVNTQ